MDFSRTTLSPLECAVLGSVISCCGELKELDLSDTELTPECIRRLAPGLICCRRVDLSLCHLTSRCCSVLSSALSSPHSRLTELELSSNNMEDSGVDELCGRLRSENCKLEKLSLSSCDLSSRCCSALSLALSSPHLQLTKLDLSKNNMGDLGVAQLCEGLRSENCKLKKLNLSGCHLTSGSCSTLSLALSSPHSRLTELDLSWNNNMGDSGVDQLCEGLRSENCKLKILRLVSCCLTSTCCSAVSSFLSSPHSQLIELKLNYNKLGNSGAHQLYEGLRSPNCKLLTLWLYGNEISESEKNNLRSLQQELQRTGQQVDIDI
ncbi:NLRP3 protein, partial [Polypterus senegalus]